MLRRFSRSLGALERLFAFVDEVSIDAGIDPDRRPDTYLIVEELFTNLVRHGVGGESNIAVELEREGPHLRIEMTDFGVQPFDPTAAPEVDITAPVEQRTPGGLGIHLVRRLTEHMAYRHEDGNGTVTVLQRVED